MKKFIKKFGIVIFFTFVGLLSLTNFIKTGSVDFISAKKAAADDPGIHSDESAALNNTFSDSSDDEDSAEKDAGRSEQKSEKVPENFSGRINLNTADEILLQTVKGIGPSKAAAIIEYRKQYGNFTCVEELTEVSGIGEKTLEKIKDYFTVE